MKVDAFRKLIWEYYRLHKRKMPWRDSQDPYHIVVSEIMLQQTQVTRVIEKFNEFIEHFPSFSSLSKAFSQSVLTIWSGMGYNRRALYLKSIAEIVTTKYKGAFPKDPLVIDELPGIGYATAQSIATFAFNFHGVFIETNIRRVFIHIFFTGEEKVDDKELIPLVEKTLDSKNPREWYYALMDYGAMLGKTVENPNKKSKVYSVQSKFEGSDRQMRGKILKELITSEVLELDAFLSVYNNDERVKRSLDALVKEGFVKEENGIYRIK